MNNQEFTSYLMGLASAIAEHAPTYELTITADKYGARASFAVEHPHVTVPFKTMRYLFYSSVDRSEDNKRTEMLLRGRLMGAPMEYVPSIHGEWREGMTL